MMTDTIVRREEILQKGRISIDLVSLFNGISTFVGYLMPKAILLEEHLWYYLTRSWEGKVVKTFHKSICPKVNLIARLEFELAYYESVVHRFNHYSQRKISIIDINENRRFENYHCYESFDDGKVSV